MDSDNINYIDHYDFFVVPSKENSSTLNGYCKEFPYIISVGWLYDTALSSIKEMVAEELSFRLKEELTIPIPLSLLQKLLHDDKN